MTPTSPPVGAVKYSTRFKRYALAGKVMATASTAGVDCWIPFRGLKGPSNGPREKAQSSRDFDTVDGTAYVNVG